MMASPFLKSSSNSNANTSSSTGATSRPDTDDPFQAFVDFATSPSSRVHPLLHPSTSESADSNNNKKNKSRLIKTPRPFSNLLNGIRQLSSQSSTTSSTSEPTTSDPSDATSGASSDADNGGGKRVISRGTFILSSGKDKYTFDSETVELPYRSIDVYERQLSHEGSSRSSSSASSPQQAGYLHPGSPPRGRSPSSLSPSPHPSQYNHHNYLTSSHHQGYQPTTPTNLTPDTISKRTLSSRSTPPDYASSSPSSPPRGGENHIQRTGSVLRRTTNRHEGASSSLSVSPPTTTASPTTPTGSIRRPFSTDGSKGGVKRGSLVRSARIELTRSIMVAGRYTNPWDTWTPQKFANILKFGLTKDKSNIPSKEQLDIVLPVVKPVFDAKIPDNCLSITWIGHSTVVVQMDGVCFITDPVFSERASPSQMVGPKRYREPACTVHDLPPNLDAVVISHNHYDHLDMPSVTLLNARYGVDLRWFIPHGLLSWFESAGCENIVELDWWEENCVPEKGDVSFVFTPAQHWSKRTLSDDNKSLWGGWAVIGPSNRFYFSGDTGYCPVFKQIGQMYGPFTAAALPIGAFEPRWFMKYQHVNPEEAVTIHQEVKSRFTLAIHWGTFSLANEYYLDPPVRLREALDAKGISPDTFVTFKHGETRYVSPTGTATPVKSPRKKYTQSMSP